MTNKGFAEKRKLLVESLKASGTIKSPAVEKAFLHVPREIFFSEQERAQAYVDSAFSIGFGQTISQPTTIAVMLEMLDARPGQKVLEVGAGSGYVLSLLSEIVGAKGNVFGIEIVPELVQQAKENLEKLNNRNIELTFRDGTLGWKEKSPFDRVVFSAAAPEIPSPIIEQLAEGGKVVAPVGNKFSQEIQLFEKKKGKLQLKDSRCCFVFVPLKGKFGWK